MNTTHKIFRSTNIITGASKGLGLSLAKKILSADDRVITISRHLNEELTTLQKQNLPIEQITCDLTDNEALVQLANQLIPILNSQTDTIRLINNAGMVDPIGLFNGCIDDEMLHTAMNLNLIAPMKLTQLFIKHVSKQIIHKQIINISSGAGRAPVAGWGVYCTTKAGLDRFSEVISIECPDIKIVSIAPGVIDTDMQATIRAQSADNFPSIDRFTQLHQTGALASSNDTAEKIIQFMQSDKFGKVVIDDIRNY